MTSVIKDIGNIGNQTNSETRADQHLTGSGCGVSLWFFKSLN